MVLVAGPEGQQLVEVEEGGDGIGVIFILFGLRQGEGTVLESGSSVKEILLIRIFVCLFCYSYNDSVS